MQLVQLISDISDLLAIEISSIKIGTLSLDTTEFILAYLSITGDQKVYFYFFKRPERYRQEVLSLFHLFAIAIYGRNCF